MYEYDVGLERARERQNFEMHCLTWVALASTKVELYVCSGGRTAHLIEPLTPGLDAQMTTAKGQLPLSS